MRFDLRYPGTCSTRLDRWPDALAGLTRVSILFMAVVWGTAALPPAAQACESCGTPRLSTLAAGFGFFNNNDQYTPQMHDLRTAAASPGWPWIAALIILNTAVISGYLKIFRFWRQSYQQELPGDRRNRLMNSAWMFLLCVICGYGMSTIAIFWPAYQLLALILLGLAVVTWKFASDLESFRESLTAQQPQRELNESLVRENELLEAKNSELNHAHVQLANTAEELRITNKDLDEFVYAASHDLKAPLRAIENLAQFVLEDAEDSLPERSRSDLSELQGRVSRMTRMLDGLLGYSRLRRLNFPAETFLIRDVIAESVRLLDIPACFTVRISDSQAQLTSPRPPLEQVIRNLIDNAVKHHDRDDGVIEIAVSEMDDHIELSVSDDGPGIAPEHQTRVFGMFKTLQRRDVVDTNGIGLTIVRRTVETHGGSVSLESQAGQGSRFTVKWPREARDTSLNNPSSIHIPADIPTDPQPSGTLSSV
jgi:signal transduction histidine kinase